MTQIAAGDRIEIFTTGGGGYGDPLDRPMEKVLEDVQSGRISTGSAGSEYGVIIAEGRILSDESEAARARLRQGRETSGFRFDRGPDYARRLGLPRYE